MKKGIEIRIYLFALFMLLNSEFCGMAKSPNKNKQILQRSRNRPFREK